MLFGGDFVYLEHLVMTEALMLFLIAATLYSTIRSIEGGDLRWFVAASFLGTLAALVRWNAFVLVLAPVVLANPPTGRFGAGAGEPTWCRRDSIRGSRTGIFVDQHVGGGYSGIADMRGWHLYGRVASFLDCEQTTADDQYPNLCEATPPWERPGPFFYSWDPNSPAAHALGTRPDPQR